MPKPTLRKNAFKQNPLNKWYLSSDYPDSRNESRIWLKRYVGKIITFTKQPCKVTPHEQKWLSNYEHTLDSFLDKLAKDERRLAYIVIHEMLKEGVVKKQSFVTFLMKHKRWNKKKAIKFVAETFGMNPNTQSVYLSDELEVRVHEKKKAESKVKK